MLRAKNIIYGFCTFTNPPKNKYLISLYRSETLHVVAVFPTSKKRWVTSKTLCLTKDHRQSIEKEVKIYNPSELSSKLLYL